MRTRYFNIKFQLRKQTSEVEEQKMYVKVQ